MTTMTPAVRPARSAAARLLRTEIVLILRDPLTLTFVFAFPIVTPINPRAAAACTMSRGNWPSSSMAAARGATCSAAKAATCP